MVNFLKQMLRETMNPENNSRMFAAVIGFVIFCVILSFARMGL